MSHFSSLELWYSGMVENEKIDIYNVTLHGIDIDGPVANIETDNIIVIPKSTIQIDDNQD